MNKRKALFLEMAFPSSAEAVTDPQMLHIVREYGAADFTIVPVLYGDAADDDGTLSDDVRRATGARVTQPLSLEGEFDPQTIWDLARRHDIDVSRSVALTAESSRTGIFLTAGVRRFASYSAATMD